MRIALCTAQCDNLHGNPSRLTVEENHQIAQAVFPGGSGKNRGGRLVQ